LTGFIRALGGAALRGRRPIFVPRRKPIFCGSLHPRRKELLFQSWIVSAADARSAWSRRSKQRTEVLIMLSWVVTFLIIALIAGVLGFGGIAGVSIEIAKTIFFIAIILFLVSAVVGLARGRGRV
jgi:uncharacterized membrane protein YtjA (UPF0391 family)